MRDPYITEPGHRYRRAMRLLFFRAFVVRLLRQIIVPSLLIGSVVYSVERAVGVPGGMLLLVGVLSSTMAGVAVMRWWRLERRQIEHRLVIERANRWYGRRGAGQ